MDCSPNNLSLASSCLRCLSDGQLMISKTYLLCAWANVVTGGGFPIVAPKTTQWTLADAGLGFYSVSIVGGTCPAGADGYQVGAVLSPGDPTAHIIGNPSCNISVTADTLIGGVLLAQIRWTLAGVPVSAWSTIKSIDLEPTAAGMAQVSDWVTRITTAGGIAPSAANQRAHGFFYDNINTNGILSKLLIVNFFTPDNLIAAITPFIKGGGSDSWANTGFVVGDLTVNGLIGDGVGKFLNTGFSPVSVLDHTKGGVIIYNVTTNNSASECEMSSFDNATTKGFQLFVSSVSNFIADGYYNGGGARISVANVGFTGFNSAQRTSATSFVGYKANSTTAHTSIVSTANDGGTPPTTAVACFCTNNSGVNANFSSKRISTAIITSGLTSTEDASAFNAVQRIRKALGGGFV